MRISSRLLPQAVRRAAPVHTGVLAQAEGRLVVDIDALGHVRQRDDIDIVRGVVARRCHGWGLNEAREALPVAIGVRVDPVADGNSWPGIGIGLIDVRLGGSVNGGEQGAEGDGGGGGLHGGRRYSIDLTKRGKREKRDVSERVEIDLQLNERPKIR